MLLHVLTIAAYTVAAILGGIALFYLVALIGILIAYSKGDK